MPPDGYENLTPAQVNRMCEENLEELRELKIERNQKYQWRPIRYECKTCQNVGWVEVPHVTYELGVMTPLPGVTAASMIDDHNEMRPECEDPRIEFKRWWN